MTTILKERMAKKKTPLPKIQPPEEGKKKRSTWIRNAIIAGTFAAIALLSVVTKEPDGVWPDSKIIITRIALLSLTTALYFFMLFWTRPNKKEEKEKAKPGKK